MMRNSDGSRYVVGDPNVRNSRKRAGLNNMHNPFLALAVVDGDDDGDDSRDTTGAEPNKDKKHKPAPKPASLQRPTPSQRVNADRRISYATAANPLLDRRAPFKAVASRKLQPTTSHQPHSFARDPDTDARAAWRHRAEPTRTMSIPATPNTISLREQNNPVSKSDVTFEKVRQIEHLTGTHIIPSWAGNTQRPLILLSIWGSQEQTNTACQQFREWINDFRPKRDEKVWAKLYNLTEAQKKIIQKSIQREERRNKYKQTPPTDAVFGWTGLMHWPTQNYKPPETFGRSCEALDPLRTKFRVYITWNSLGHFSIQGDSQEQVERVMKCINNTYRQLVARSFASQVTRKILLKPPTAANLLSTVNTTPYHHRQILPSTDSQRNVGVTPTLGGPPFETNQYLRKCAALFIENSRNEDIILGSIMKALDRVRWFRANIHLRIRLGTFVLTRYKKNAGVPFKLSEFEDMMKSGSMEGQITKSIGDTAIEEKLLSTITQASDLLIPHSAIIKQLTDVTPVISGAFIFKSPDNDGHFRLDIEFKQMKDWMERLSTRWSKLDGKTASQVLGISHIRLETGMGWQFSLATMTPIPVQQVPEHYRSFAESIKVVSSKGFESLVQEERYFTFDSPLRHKCLPLILAEERAVWRYNMTKSEYVCEVSKSRMVQLESLQEAARGPAPAESQPRTGATPDPRSRLRTVASDPEWSLEVYHNGWEALFDRSSHLSIGDEAPWKAGPEVFFPADIADADMAAFAKSNVHAFSEEYQLSESEGGTQSYKRKKKEQATNEDRDMKSVNGATMTERKDASNTEGFKSLMLRLRKLEAIVLEKEFLEHEYPDPPCDWEAVDETGELLFNDEEAYLAEDDETVDDTTETNNDETDGYHDWLKRLKKSSDQEVPVFVEVDSSGEQPTTNPGKDIAKNQPSGRVREPASKGSDKNATNGKLTGEGEGQGTGQPGRGSGSNTATAKKVRRRQSFGEKVKKTPSGPIEWPEEAFFPDANDAAPWEKSLPSTSNANTGKLIDID